MKKGLCYNFSRRLLESRSSIESAFQNIEKGSVQPLLDHCFNGVGVFMARTCNEKVVPNFIHFMHLVPVIPIYVIMCITDGFSSKHHIEYNDAE